MSLFKKPSFALRLLGATGIAALTSFVLPSTSWAEPTKIIEGQALLRWHTYALSQGLSAPNENKESNLFRRWAESVVASRLAKALKGSTLKQVYPNVGWALVDLPKNVKTEVGVSLLRTAFGSGNAVPNTVTRINALPNDTNYAQQWWAGKIKAPFAWDGSTGSQDVIVAVLDSGSQLANTDLQPNLWRNTAEVAGDGLDNDGNGYVDDVYGINSVNYPQIGEYERGMAPNDTEGHGTHVAGIIGAAGNNATGIAGVNWRVRIMSLRFIGDSGYGSEAAILEAIDYVLMMKKRGVNIRVTNNSWGGSYRSSAIEDGFRKLNTAKILNVCAAGNGTTYYNGANNDSTPNYPSSFNNTSIIAVAATDQNDNRATFSNYGAKSVDLAAPGVDIFSLGLTPSGMTLDGTSMATPMVTGAAALILSTQPKLTVSQLRSKLLAGVDKVPALNKVVVTGGRLNLARLMGQSRVTVSGETYYKDKKKVVFKLAGVEVRAINSKKVTISTLTDKDGQFSFADLPIGSYTFTPVLAGYKFSSKKVTLSDKSTPAFMKLEAQEPSSLYSISGRAYNLGGGTVSGVEIFLNGSSKPIAVTDYAGYYSVSSRPQGTYALTASSPNTEWVASSSSVTLPATTGASVPNSVVNFTVKSSDNAAPVIAIAAPTNGLTFQTGPQAATGSATDATAVATLYYTLERSIGGQISYYNWTNSAWTNNSSDEGTIKAVSQSGTYVNWSVNLPSQINAGYTLRSWGVDTYGNETPIGAETTSNWTVNSAAITSLSIKRF